MKWGTIIYYTTKRGSMATVGVRKSVKYGFVLLGYFVSIFIVGGIIAGIGSLILEAGRESGGAGGLLLVLVGFIIGFVGLFILVAGFIGINYKVIADGVKHGIENSTGFTSDTESEERNLLKRKDQSSSSRSSSSSSPSGETPSSPDAEGSSSRGEQSSS